MSTAFIAPLIVLVIFGGALFTVRQNVHDRKADSVKASRRLIAAQLRALASDIQLRTNVTYRWKPFNNKNPNDWVPAQFIATSSVLFLLPSPVLIATGGIGLVLPSYAIPISTIREIRFEPAPRRPFDRLFPAALSQRLLVTIDSGATCWVGFRDDSVLRDAAGLLGSGGAV